MAIFKFKYFHVEQGESLLKVGTDAMVLGAIASFEKTTNLIDIGCGTGVLSLMMAQKNSNLQVLGIDNHIASIQAASLNFQNSPFPNEMNVSHESFLDLSEDLKFDGIICNPPFYEDAISTENEDFNKAKHVLELSPERLLTKINVLAADEAEFWFIWPHDQRFRMESILEGKGWIKKEDWTIYGKPSVAVRTIQKWTNSKAEKINVLEKNLLIRNEEGKFSDEYKELTKEFHDRALP